MLTKVLLLAVVLIVSQADDSALKEPHPDCPADGHWLLPHEYDCTLFYYCEGGEKFIKPRDCAPGTEFSPVLQVCVWPHLADCNLPGYQPSGTEDPATEEPTAAPTTAAPTTAAPTTAASTTAAPTTAAPTTAASTTAAPTTAAPTTAAPTTAAPTTAAPTTAAPTTAAPTTAAPTTAAPTDAPTTAAPITTTTVTATPTNAPTDAPTETSTTAAPTAAPTTAPTDAPTTQDPCAEEEDRRCEEECNVLPWAHKDCDKFWLCEDKSPKLVTCSEGLRFNPDTYSCDFTCNVNCEREHIQTSSGPDGIKLFLPWNQINSKTKDLLSLIA